LQVLPFLRLYCVERQLKVEGRKHWRVDKFVLLFGCWRFFLS